MMDATTALAKLIEGNKRFSEGKLSLGEAVGSVRPEALVRRQEPFAVILGCSDSRVPAELVFDQGLGNLFVVRVAGNIAAPSQIASVEFAAHMFKTRLVVVLGHSHCGAVLATIESINSGPPSRLSNLQSITERIRPAIEQVLSTNDTPLSEVHRSAVRANVLASVEQITAASSFLKDLVSDGLQVVGAEYSLETGLVEFL